MIYRVVGVIKKRAFPPQNVALKTSLNLPSKQLRSIG